jgi:hypothetical protein
MRNRELGIEAPNILLPNSGVDLTLWSVVACDQFTSQPEYWEKLADEIGEDPSTLNLVFPEVYLGDADSEQRVDRINATMEAYLQKGVLEELEPGFVLLDRKTSHAPSRKGLIVALDLEKYDYKPGSQSLIRATEGTIEDRLPPRIKIRKNAKIELPHIMVLIDDPDRTVIEPLFEKDLSPIYDFELNAGGGHLRGWRVDAQEDMASVFQSLEALSDQSVFDSKYGVLGKGVLLYAMGDGNHSLATAKSIWESLKAEADSPESVMDHPARFALVELMNVHDEGLEFEPIHRVAFGVDADELLLGMKQFFADEGSEVALELFDSLESAKKRLANLDSNPSEHRVLWVAPNEHGLIRLSNPSRNLEVGNLQAFLDAFLEGSESELDYIHGEDVVEGLGSKEGNIGFILPGIGKSDLFKTVVLDGALPRKTFSMGKADEKRYYLEARRIQ